MSKKVEAIYKYTFESCFALKKVKNTKQIEFVGHYAFKNCLKLRYIEFSYSADVADNAFANCPVADIY